MVGIMAGWVAGLAMFSSYSAVIIHGIDASACYYIEEISTSLHRWFVGFIDNMLVSVGIGGPSPYQFSVQSYWSHGAIEW